MKEIRITVRAVRDDGTVATSEKVVAQTWPKRTTRAGMAERAIEAARAAVRAVAK